MTEAGTSDRVNFKDGIRAEWDVAAPGWHKWMSVCEGVDSLPLVSARLVALAGISLGDRVLDVAAGYGEPALTAARAAGPTGRVVCTDISSAMLDVARERAEQAGITTVEFLQADAERLDLDPRSFDAVISRAGIMFFADVVASLTRLRALLVSGGCFAASVWATPEKVAWAAPVPIIRQALGLAAPPPGPGPFALGDPDLLAKVVGQAGFAKVAIEEVDVDFEMGSPAAATEWLRDVAPPITALVEGQPPEVRDGVWSAVTDTWERFCTADGHVHLASQAVLVSGTA